MTRLGGQKRLSGIFTYGDLYSTHPTMAAGWDLFAARVGKALHKGGRVTSNAAETQVQGIKLNIDKFEIHSKTAYVC